MMTHHDDDEWQSTECCSDATAPDAGMYLHEKIGNCLNGRPKLDNDKCEQFECRVNANSHIANVSERIPTVCEARRPCPTLSVEIRKKMDAPSYG